ncbi:MAG: FAD-binding protein [bacterium]|nr:FAD-binding protein [bacterium]
MTGRLKTIMAAEDVIDSPALMSLYDADSQRVYQRSPDLLLLPRNGKEVAGIVRLAADEGVPLTARGAGTGLSGGAVPLEGGWLIAFTRMRGIISIDADDRTAWVRPGLVNGEFQAELQPLGLHFAPDPSSQNASTIGGNVAENAGGPHCFKIGVTTQHVLGLEIVDDRGEIHRIGTGSPGGDPLDACGLITGSEGTLALVTAIQVRLSPLPEGLATILAPFASLEAACASVTEFLGRGSLPAAVEILDRETIRAVEGSVFRAGYPAEAEAVLLVEVDGLPEQVERDRREVIALLEASGALWVQHTDDPVQRLKLWRGRKGAFGASGRLYRDICVQDICVPISRLPEAISEVNRLAAKHELPVANVFHAGDGNMHPNIGFDREDAAQVERLHALFGDLMELSLRLGGTLSGEHGIGIEKSTYLPLALTAADLRPLRQLKAALDPAGLFNPGKIFPAASGGTRAGGPQGVVTPGAAGVIRDEASTFQRPGDEAELVAILKGREGLGKLLLPTGARRLAELPRLPGPVQWLISTASLHGVNDISRQDFHVSVSAGTPWSELTSILATEGLELDWDIPRPNTRSIGGVAACDESWPWRAGLRNPRDRILGLDGVLADGSTFAAGGKVFKNVTGYDLPRLLTGSRGALGIITSLCFRTRPLPARRRLLVLAYAERERVLSALRLLTRTLDYPEGMLLTPPGLDLVGLPSAWHLAIGLVGESDMVERQEMHLLNLLGGRKLSPLERSGEEGREGPLYRMLRDFPTMSDRSPQNNAGLTCRLCELRVPLSALVGILPYLGKRWIYDCHGCRLRTELVGDDARVLLPPDADALFQRMAAIDGDVEGGSTFMNLTGQLFLERIARALDPAGRFASGRWLFG